MEKIEKNKIQTLVENATELTAMAAKCFRLGLIHNFKSDIDFSSEEEYTVSVRVNAYYTEEKGWQAEHHSYLKEEDQPEATGSVEEMCAYLEDLIATRRKELEAELEIVEG